MSGKDEIVAKNHGDDDNELDDLLSSKSSYMKFLFFDYLHKKNDVTHKLNIETNKIIFFSS